MASLSSTSIFDDGTLIKAEEKELYSYWNLTLSLQKWEPK